MTLKHDDYIAEVIIDPKTNLLCGSVANLTSPVTFQAETVEQLRHEFEASIRVYLETCEEYGITPEKPLSGKFNVRLGEELHRIAAMAAAARDESLNDFVKEAVKREAEAELASA